MKKPLKSKDLIELKDVMHKAYKPRVSLFDWLVIDRISYINKKAFDILRKNKRNKQ